MPGGFAVRAFRSQSVGRSVLVIFITAIVGNAGSVAIPRAKPLLLTDRPAGSGFGRSPWLRSLSRPAGSVLRGGGLFGIGNYDDGVYYAAATGLIHGLLPIRTSSAPSTGNLAAAGTVRFPRAGDRRLVRFRCRAPGVDAAGSPERRAGLENPQACRHGRGRVRWAGLRRVLPSRLLREIDASGEPGHHGASRRHAPVAAARPRQLVASRQGLRRRGAAGLTITIKVWESSPS